MLTSLKIWQDLSSTELKPLAMHMTAHLLVSTGLQSRYSDHPMDYSKYDNGQRWTGDVMEQAIRSVSVAFPFWNASRGADHFTFMATELGRCDTIMFLPPIVVGELRIVTVQSEVGHWRSVYFSKGKGERLEFGCYRHEHDVAMPSFYSNGSGIQPTPPLLAGRDISLLLRFGDKHVKYGRVRKRILDHFRGAAVQGQVVLGVASPQQTDQEMRRSVFCVTPPGSVQQTALFYRAIFNGCIPVTFFYDVDLPFARISGLAYENFIVNFDLWEAPSKMALVGQLLEYYLALPEKIRSLQENLAAAQHMFNWDRQAVGAQAAVFEELAVVGQNVSRRHERTHCNMRAAVSHVAERVRQENAHYWADPNNPANNPYMRLPGGPVVSGDLNYLHDINL